MQSDVRLKPSSLAASWRMVPGEQEQMTRGLHGDPQEPARSY